jgi:hypothetical protein
MGKSRARPAKREACKELGLSCEKFGQYSEMMVIHGSTWGREGVTGVGVLLRLT